MTVTSKSEPRTNLLLGYLPILGWLPEYDRSWLHTDLIAGLTVVALLIPENMAYARIAGCAGFMIHWPRRNQQRFI